MGVNLVVLLSGSTQTIIHVVKENDENIHGIIVNQHKDVTIIPHHLPVYSFCSIYVYFMYICSGSGKNTMEFPTYFKIILLA